MYRSQRRDVLRRSSSSSSEMDSIPDFLLPPRLRHKPTISTKSPSSSSSKRKPHIIRIADLPPRAAFSAFLASRHSSHRDNYDLPNPPHTPCPSERSVSASEAVESQGLASTEVEELFRCQLQRVVALDDLYAILKHTLHARYVSEYGGFARRSNRRRPGTQRTRTIARGDPEFEDLTSVPVVRTALQKLFEANKALRLAKERFETGAIEVEGGE